LRRISGCWKREAASAPSCARSRSEDAFR